jgi:hypothetical protein
MILLLLLLLLLLLVQFCAQPGDQRQGGHQKDLQPL